MLCVAWQSRLRTICRAAIDLDLLERHATTNRMIEEESSGAKRLKSWRANKSSDRKSVQQIAPYADGIAAICRLIKIYRSFVAGILTDN